MTTKTLKWSRADIRSARHADLPSLLRREGLNIRETGGADFELIDHPGLIIKEHYWHWPDQNRQGNAIDLFVNVLGWSFNKTMKYITQT